MHPLLQAAFLYSHLRHVPVANKAQTTPKTPRNPAPHFRWAASIGRHAPTRRPSLSFSAATWKCLSTTTTPMRARLSFISSVVRPPCRPNELAPCSSTLAALASAAVRLPTTRRITSAKVCSIVSTSLVGTRAALDSPPRQWIALTPSMNMLVSTRHQTPPKKNKH